MSFRAVEASQWPQRRGIATCQLPEGRDERPSLTPSSLSPQGCHPENWRATIPKTGRPPYFFQPGVRRQVLPAAPPRAWCFLVEAHGAVMIFAQKVPFLTDADPSSHRVRLWRGRSVSIAACPLRPASRHFLSWWRTVACLSLRTTIPRRYMARFREVGQGQGCLVLFFKGVFDGHSRILQVFSVAHDRET